MDNPVIQPPVKLPEKKKFNPLVWVFVFIVIFIFCAAGMYVWQKQSGELLSQNTPLPEIISTPVPSVIQPSASQIPIDWKIYKDEKYKYELWYPQTWNIVEDCPVRIETSNPVCISSSGLEKDQNYDIFKNGNLIILEGEEGVNSAVGQQLEDFCRSGDALYNCNKIQGINWSGYRKESSNISNIGILREGDQKYYLNIKFVFNIKDNRTIEGKSEAEKIFSQILSTFKFTASSQIIGENRDILTYLVEWTSPMKWSARNPETIDYYRIAGKNTILTGVLINSSINDKSENKIGPLTSSDDKRLKSQGWIEDWDNSGAGRGEARYAYLKDQNGKKRALIISQKAGFSVFYSDEF